MTGSVRAPIAGAVPDSDHVVHVTPGARENPVARALPPARARVRGLTWIFRGRHRAAARRGRR
jgi:hypothetical protein